MFLFDCFWKIEFTQPFEKAALNTKFDFPINSLFFPFYMSWSFKSLSFFGEKSLFIPISYQIFYCGSYSLNYNDLTHLVWCPNFCPIPWRNKHSCVFVYLCHLPSWSSKVLIFSINLYKIQSEDKYRVQKFRFRGRRSGSSSCCCGRQKIPLHLKGTRLLNHENERALKLQ